MKKRRRGLSTGLFLLLFFFFHTLPARGIDLARLNRHILTLTPLMTDPLSLPSSIDRDIIMIFAGSLKLPQDLYFRDGTPVPPSFFKNLEENMALEKMPQEVTLTPALVTQPTLARCLPTEEALFKSPQEAKEGDIDVNLSTSIPPGTPLVVVHTTRDSQWALTLSTYNPGWVPVRDLVTTTWEDMRAYATYTPFAVITVAHCPVFSSILKGVPIFTLPMGTRVPLVGSKRGLFKILLPVAGGPRTWKEFYIPRRLANRGYLPFREETLTEQAYGFLGEPYSWGGKDGVDCSLLVREVFATTGVILPRNSFQQARVGTIIWTPESREDLDQALWNTPKGRTLIFLKGHVMIYMGRENGEPQGLHSLYSWQGEKVERVVLTPLEPFKEKIVRVITIP